MNEQPRFDNGEPIRPTWEEFAESEAARRRASVQSAIEHHRRINRRIIKWTLIALAIITVFAVLGR